MRRLVFAGLVLFSVSLSCKNEDSPVEPGGFAIVVVSQDTVALSGVFVEARIAGETFSTTTGSGGLVQIPMRFANGIIGLAKTDFIPTRVIDIANDTVFLPPAEMTLRELGPVEGTPVRFWPDRFVTFDFRGFYRLYAYTDVSVTEIVTARFSDTTISIHKFSASGDTLWFTTLAERLIYAISMVEPAQPIVLHTFPLPAAAGPIASRDSLIILGEDEPPGAVRIIAFRDTSSRELASIEQFFPEHIKLIRNAAVLYGGNPLYAVFDISDPEKPRLTHQLLLGGTFSTFMYGTTIYRPPVEQIEQNASVGIPLRYPAVELADPFSPAEHFGFSADSWISAVTSATTATGVSYYHAGTRTFLQGSRSGSMRTIAALSGSTPVSVDGALPPFYVLNQKLWKME